MNIISNINYYKSNFKNIFFSNFLLIAVFFYVLGPAISNFFLFTISCLTAFLLFRRRIYFDFNSKVLFFIFVYFLIKEIFLSEKFNFDLIVFFSFFLFFLYISNQKFSFDFTLNYPLYLFSSIILIDTIFQYFIGYNILGFPKYDGVRLTSFFYDEPIIGSFLTKIFFPIIVFLSFTKTKVSKIVFFFFFLLFPLAVFLSGERMPFLTLVLGLIFLFFLLKFNKIKITFLLFSFILGFFLLNNNYIKDRYMNTYNSLINLNLNNIYFKSSIDIYIANFSTGLNVWSENKFFGSGYRGYRNNCKKINLDKYYVSPDKKVSGCSTHPHNIYIEILSDHGIIGFIFFIYLFMSLIFSYFKNYRNNSKNIGFFITFLIIIFPFSTSQSIFSSYYGYLFFLFLGMLNNIIVHNNKKLR